jgi:uncharacterized protein (DUF2336 family)
MNTAASLRDKLHQYIDVADEQKLQAIYVLLEDDIDHKYSSSEIDMFHERRDSHLNEDSESYSVDESLKAVRKQKK